MPSIHKSLQQITALEELSQTNTPLHAMTSWIKIIITFVYVIIVVSFPHGDFDGVLLYACFPVLLMIIGEIPIRPILFRCMIALPFVIFAGISHLIYNREIALWIGGIGITEGEIAMVTLILKTLLTVMAILILVATTGIRNLSYGLSSLQVPSILIMQLIMTYHYISIIVEEALSMHQAYQLRAPLRKGIKYQDYSKFIGLLLLRSFDRAERVYQSMLCKGFQGRVPTLRLRCERREILWLVITLIMLVVFRFIHIGEMIGVILIR